LHSAVLRPDILVYKQADSLGKCSLGENAAKKFFSRMLRQEGQSVLGSVDGVWRGKEVAGEGNKPKKSRVEAT
jgi:hypothetical protein